MSTTHWISTISLPPELAERLVEQYLREPGDFEHIEVHHLTAEPLKIPVGLAARIVGLAKNNALTDGKEELKISNALTFLGSLKHDKGLTLCRSLGIFRVVINDDGNINITKSLQYIEENQPTTQLYDGGLVVDIEEIGAKKKHHPRTGVRLTKADSIGFVNLDRDKLIIARAIFITPDILAGESDRVVLADVLANGSMSKQAVILLHRKEFADLCGQYIDYGDKLQQEYSIKTLLPNNSCNNLCNLLKSLFNSDELRRFIKYSYPDLNGELPGPAASLTEVACLIADKLRSRGYINMSLRQSLRAERPRRADEIDSFFAALGVL